MTKRFRQFGLWVYDESNDRYMNVKSVVDKLNELNDERMMYKTTIDKRIVELEEENKQLKVANARWLDKSLQDKQIRYSNANHKELTKKYLQLKEENEQLRQELNDCEKFRHSVFKRIEKTIENKNNCAINKDAKYPCKAYDECLKRKGTNKPLPCMVNWMMGRTFENMLRKEEDDE